MASQPTDALVPSWWQHDDRCDSAPRRHEELVWQTPAGGWQQPFYPPSGPFGYSGGDLASYNTYGGGAGHGGGDMGDTVDKLVRIVDGLAKDLRQECLERKALEEAFYAGKRGGSPYAGETPRLSMLAAGSKDESSPVSGSGSDYGKAPRRLSRGWASVLTASSSPRVYDGGPRNALK